MSRGLGEHFAGISGSAAVLATKSVGGVVAAVSSSGASVSSSGASVVGASVSSVSGGVVTAGSTIVPVSLGITLGAVVDSAAAESALSAGGAADAVVSVIDAVVVSDVDVAVLPRLKRSGRKRPPLCLIIEILRLMINSGMLPPKSGVGFRVPARIGPGPRGRFGLERRGLHDGLVISTGKEALGVVDVVTAAPGWPNLPGLLRVTRVRSLPLRSPIRVPCPGPRILLFISELDVKKSSLL